MRILLSLRSALFLRGGRHSLSHRSYLESHLGRDLSEETIGPDPHAAGSPLPTSAYAADIGYLVDGTPIDAAGNNAIH